MKKYKLVKGIGGGANPNTIGIVPTGDNEESAVFVGRVRKKAEELFGKGGSLDSIGTSYGVYFRYPCVEKNRKMVKILIKIVKLEQELIEIKIN